MSSEGKRGDRKRERRSQTKAVLKKEKKMGCPKCGYSGHSTVYHWGTGETECGKCRHDYVVNKKPKEERSEFFGFPLFDSGKEIRFSKDVWVSPNGKTSMFRPVGGERKGSISPLLGDDSVVDHNLRTIGRIDGNGYFVPSWRV